LHDDDNHKLYACLM